MKSIPSCKHPTRVLFIDDEPDFLMSIAANLSAKSAAYVFFDSPERAIHYINDEYHSDPFTQRSVSNSETYHYEHHALEVNLSTLYQEIYNPNRFNQISTVIIDYDMPGINGLEVCQAINDPYVQKILLTGAADEHLAVQAFNQGLIHKYIRKQTKNIFEHLETAIQESQDHYFKQLSNILTTALNSHDNIPTALNNPAFVSYFEKIIKEHDIVEYYQFERTGSFILANSKAALWGIFTYSEDRMNADYLEVEDENESVISTEAKNALKEKKKMLCYFKEGQTFLPHPETWEQFLFPTTFIDGTNKYYVACTPNAIAIDSQKIVSFNTYKQEQPQAVAANA